MYFDSHSDFYKRLNIIDNSIIKFFKEYKIFENYSDIIKSTAN